MDKENIKTLLTNLIVTIVLSAFTAYIASSLNMNKDLKLTIADKKRANYERIIEYTKGFFKATENIKKIEYQTLFFEESRRAFLYASDDVIRNLNKFYNNTASNNFDAKIGMKILQELTLSMRKDIGIKTHLSTDDIQY